jgi:hypothetical protein
VNLQDISTQLLFTTMPIWVERHDGKQAFGTAFILSLPVPNRTDQQIPLLVTNAHVVSNAKRGLIDLVEREGAQPKPRGRLRIEIPGNALTQFTDTDLDLAMLPIGGLLNQLEQEKRPVFFRSVSADLIPSADALAALAAMEEITFIGYPSGLYDEHNVTPIIRRGITATPPWNDFQGQPTFLIDAGVFPGSSGSPVFILNQGAYPTKDALVVGSRLLFLGVLSESILRTEPNVPPVFLGIGKVLKSERVQAFASRVVAQLPQ